MKSKWHLQRIAQPCALSEEQRSLNLNDEVTLCTANNHQLCHIAVCHAVTRQLQPFCDANNKRQSAMEIIMHLI